LRKLSDTLMLYLSVRRGPVKALISKNAMYYKKTHIAHGKGFTIVELMVATAVFSVVLLVALTGFLQIGHLFYKGVSNTQTQDTTRQLVNDITSNLKATPSSVAIPITQATASQPYNYFCAGAYRYTSGNYLLTSDPRNGHPAPYISTSAPNYDVQSGDANMGLAKDLVGSGNCPAPCASNAPTSHTATHCSGTKQAISASATQLMGNGMRVGSLTLSPVSGTIGLYNLNVAVVYGDDSVLDFSTTPPSCQGSSSQQKFCAVDQLSTSIFKGELHP